jgi:hypothetical protein
MKGDPVDRLCHYEGDSEKLEERERANISLALGVKR